MPGTPAVNVAVVATFIVAMAAGTVRMLAPLVPHTVLSDAKNTPTNIALLPARTFGWYVPDICSLALVKVVIVPGEVLLVLPCVNVPKLSD